MILVNIKTKEPVNMGETLTSFRGEKAILAGGSEPHKPGSTGRVYVKGRMISGEFFPSVFNCEWIAE